MIIWLKGEISSSPSSLQSLVYIIAYQSLLELDWILRSWLLYIHTYSLLHLVIGIGRPHPQYINASTHPHFISK